MKAATSPAADRASAMLAVARRIVPNLRPEMLQAFTVSSIAQRDLALPLQQVESEPPTDLHKVDAGTLTLDEAKALAGRIVGDVLHDTRSPLKAFGDKSQVGRWKQGKENPNLALLIQTADARKAMAKALLKTVAGVRMRMVFDFEETA